MNFYEYIVGKIIAKSAYTFQAKQQNGFIQDSMNKRTRTSIKTSLTIPANTPQGPRISYYDSFTYILCNLTGQS